MGPNKVRVNGQNWYRTNLDQSQLMPYVEKGYKFVPILVGAEIVRTVRQGTAESKGFKDGKIVRQVRKGVPVTKVTYNGGQVVYFSRPKMRG